MNAERITNALPPEIRMPMTARSSAEPPRPKLDPISAYGLDRDFTAEAEALARPGYAPPSEA